MNNRAVADAVHAAAGRQPGTILLKNVQVVNVFSGEIYETNILVKGPLIAAVGQGQFEADESIDLQGYTAIPGLIDGHMHFESSLLEVSEYARAVVPRGVTAVVCDPHEVANVLGIDGIRYILDASAGLPLDVFATASSCVPATDLETSGANLKVDDLETLLHHERVVGIAELMNFPAMAQGDPEQLAKARLAEKYGVVADGHAPGLSGRDLCAYVAAGVQSDHESVTIDEAREKLRLGMHIMIREGSAAQNLNDLLPLVTESNQHQFFFVTDDVAPHSLANRGGIDYVVRKAISLGLNPVTAIRMATINTARYFRLPRRGAIAPGYIADIAIVDNLKDLTAHIVLKSGNIVARDGTLLHDIRRHRDERVFSTVHLPPNLSEKSLALPHNGGPARVIGVIPDQIVTRSLVLTPKVQDGYAVTDPDQDLAKLAVIERHGKSGNVGVGLVQGFGIKRGAIASTVAHDSHNILVCGMSDDCMLLAAKTVAELGGGFAVVDQGKVLATLALPIAGLLAQSDLTTVVKDMEAVTAAAKSLGITLNQPFATLSFLALTVIPELKLSDFGLIDVARAQVVPFAVTD